MSRYLTADKTNHMDSELRLAPDGHCQWCGKELPKRCTVFCPSIVRAEGTPWAYRFQVCAAAYFHFWQAIPRFKRVVFIRDTFTCQVCSLRPVTQNEHGIEIPAIGLLAIDHIFPYSKGGKTEPGNLRVLCRVCNGRKSDKVDVICQGSMPGLDKKESLGYGLHSTRAEVIDG